MRTFRIFLTLHAEFVFHVQTTHPCTRSTVVEFVRTRFCWFSSISSPIEFFFFFTRHDCFVLAFSFSGLVPVYLSLGVRNAWSVFSHCETTQNTSHVAIYWTSLSHGTVYLMLKCTFRVSDGICMTLFRAIVISSGYFHCVPYICVLWLFRSWFCTLQCWLLIHVTRWSMKTWIAQKNVTLFKDVNTLTVEVKPLKIYQIIISLYDWWINITISPQLLETEICEILIVSSYY